MREDSSFETVKIDLSKELDGLDDEIDLGAGNWITFGYIPSDVQVFFALDNNSSSKIQAKQGLQIKVPHSKVYLWSVGTNATEQMEVMHWGSSDIQMIMPPRSDFDSLNGYGSLALTQLDKIINPYNEAFYDNAQLNSTSETNLYSFVSTFDKISILVSGKRDTSNAYESPSYVCTIYVEDKIISYATASYDADGRGNPPIHKIILDNILGNNVTIKGYTSSTILNVSLKKQTKKA